MSVATLIMELSKEMENKMTVLKLDNGVIVPLHWNDRYYIADCVECGTELATRTTAEMKTEIQNHICNRLV